MLTGESFFTPENFDVSGVSYEEDAVNALAT
jgi:hypothetical protein